MPNNTIKREPFFDKKIIIIHNISDTYGYLASFCELRLSDFVSHPAHFNLVMMTFISERLLSPYKS